MLSRNFLPFLLVVKMVVSQTVYPTTQVSYSTNAVPTVQTIPVSPLTVTAVPTATAAIPATASITATAMPITAAITARAIPAATAVTATAMPAAVVSISPTVTLASPSSPAMVVTCPIPSATKPKVTVSSVPSSFQDPTEPRAYFLPANVPDPKVTILSKDLPTVIDVKPTLCEEDARVEIKATVCPDQYSKPAVIKKDYGPMTAVKRITMACTDEVPINPIAQPVCPGIPEMDITPTPVVSKNLKSNPIDFDGLLDSFMTFL